MTNTKKSPFSYEDLLRFIQNMKNIQIRPASIGAEIVTSGFASEQHKKEHKLSNLEEVFNKKKDHIKKDKEEIKQLLSATEDNVNEIENQVANLDVNYKKLTAGMSKNREELHRKIDIFMNKRETKIGETKTKLHAILIEKLNGSHSHLCKRRFMR